MAQTRNVIINFITKLQERGLQRMQRQTYGLNKSFLALQKSMRRFIGLTAIFALLRKSVKNFVDEAAEIKRLEIAVNGLNDSFAALQVEDFIANLQRLTGVSDGQLRPSLARLARELKNVTSAQTLLQVAIDVSRGSGQDLETVTRALTRAYNGESTALKRLQLGVSRTSLESKNFGKILTELQTLYGGAGAKYLDTYAGKMDLLRATTEDATEILGEGLIKGIEALGGNDLQEGLNSIIRAAELIGLGFEKAGKFVADFKSAFTFIMEGPFTQKGRDAFFGREAEKDFTSLAARRRAEFLKTKRQQEILNKIAAEAAKRQAEIDRKKRAEKAAKDAADALKKRLEAKFDIDNINLAAAAQRNLSESDRARVEALQALKTEGVEDDKAALNELIALEKKREEEIKRQASQSILASAVVKDQRLTDLKAELDMLNKIADARFASITGQPVRTDLSGMSAASAYVQGTRNIGVAGGAGFLDFLFSGETVNPTGMAPLNAAAPGNQSVVVNQYISGNVTTERELFENYVDAIFQINRQGTNSQLVNLGR